MNGLHTLQPYFSCGTAKFLFCIQLQAKLKHDLHYTQLNTVLYSADFILLYICLKMFPSEKILFTLHDSFCCQPICSCSLQRVSLGTLTDKLLIVSLYFMGSGTRCWFSLFSKAKSQFVIIFMTMLLLFWNSHLKRADGLGCWKIELKSLPTHPTPHPITKADNLQLLCRYLMGTDR